MINFIEPLIAYFPSAPMPLIYRLDKKLRYKPKGVAARNAGIDWVKNHTEDGVLYFMDDDNTYDLRLFQEVGLFVPNCLLRLLINRETNTCN